nr:MAG TPA: hypothetical protein [Caudoviricetes sp.]DAU02670.1 MAG TPA: hypothetical protein [Caudoviricetes sp.]
MQTTANVLYAQQWKWSHCALIIANWLSFRKLFKEIL